MHNTIFETTETINNIKFDIEVLDNGSAIIEMKRRRTSVGCYFSATKNTLKIIARHNDQMWIGVPSIRDMFFILEDEAASTKWTPAQCDLMWDVARI